MTTDLAAIFRSLHLGPDLLRLPNAWDAGSARLVEHLGARAVATTSAGMAWALGYPDGDRLPIDRLVAAVAAITRVVRIPVSVDVEGGYSSEPAEVGAAVAALIDAGAVGINLEDGAGSPELACAKIAMVKQVGARLGVELFVNARTDVYLRSLVPQPERVAEVVARARRYRDAGADGLFVPKVVDPTEIAPIVAAVDLPLNVLAWPDLPAPAELQRLGVRRLSAGSGIAHAAWVEAAARTAAFLGEPSGAGAMGYAEINALFTEIARR